MQKKLYNRWLVVLGGIIIQFCLGATYSWSVVQLPLQKMFNWNAKEVSLAFSLALALGPILMILTGRLLDKLGPTKMGLIGAVFLAGGQFMTSRITDLSGLYLSYGLMVGTGLGISYGIPIATCVRWFPDKRGMISGLAVAGYGLGSVFFAPIATYLVELHGPLNMFFYQSIYSLIIVSIGALLMRPAPDNFVPEGWIPPTTKNLNNPTSYSFTTREMLKTPNYYFLVIMYAFATIAGLMIIGHASPIGQQVAGLTAIQAGSVVSILAIVNTLGRLFWPTLSDKIGRMRVVFFMYLISSLTMFSLNSLSNFSLYALGVGLIAFCFGGAMGTFPSITADFYGAKNVSTNYGFIFLAYTIGALFGPRLASTVVVSSGGSYHLAFIVSGILCAIGAIMALISRPPRSPEK